MRKTLIAGLVLAAAAAWPGSAVAVDAETIVKALTPKPAPPVTRSYRQGPTRGISVEGSPEPDEPAPTINLHINFEFNSSTLTNDGALTIKTLAEALNDKRLADMRFRIVGHTDARGTDEYNQALSQRRADTVKSRLMQYHQMNDGRLEVAGKGKRELLKPEEPEHELNRRVEIINISNMAAERSR